MATASSQHEGFHRRTKQALGVEARSIVSRLCHINKALGTKTTRMGKALSAAAAENYFKEREDPLLERLALKQERRDPEEQRHLEIRADLTASHKQSAKQHNDIVRRGQQHHFQVAQALTSLAVDNQNSFDQICERLDGIERRLDEHHQHKTRKSLAHRARGGRPVCGHIFRCGALKGQTCQRAQPCPHHQRKAYQERKRQPAQEALQDHECGLQPAQEQWELDGGKVLGGLETNQELYKQHGGKELDGLETNQELDGTAWSQSRSGRRNGAGAIARSPASPECILPPSLQRGRRGVAPRASFRPPLGADDQQAHVVTVRLRHVEKRAEEEFRTGSPSLS